VLIRKTSLNFYFIQNYIIIIVKCQLFGNFYLFLFSILVTMIILTVRKIIFHSHCFTVQKILFLNHVKNIFYSESSLTRLGHLIGALDRDCVRVMTVRGMWVALLAKKISDQFFWRKKFICKNASSKTRKLQVLVDNNSGESCNNL